MRTIITILNITLICIVSTVRAQSLGDSLLQLEYSYWKSNDIGKAIYAYKRFQLMLKNDMAGDSNCYREMQRVKWEKLPDSLQSDFLWNATLVSLLHSDYNSSAEKLKAYQLLTKEETETIQFLNLLAQSHSTTPLIDTSAISDSLQVFCRCIQDELSQNDTVYKKYTSLSFLLPGAGTAFKGYPGRGLLSLGLTGGSVSLVYLLMRSNLYLNALGYFSLTFMKFYSGNLVLSKKLIPKQTRKIQLQHKTFCDQELLRLLKKYPFVFR